MEVFQRQSGQKLGFTTKVDSNYQHQDLLSLTYNQVLQNNWLSMTEQSLPCCSVSQESVPLDVVAPSPQVVRGSQYKINLRLKPQEPQNYVVDINSRENHDIKSIIQHNTYP